MKLRQINEEVLQALYDKHYKKIAKMDHVIWEDTPILSFDQEVRGFIWADIVEYMENMDPSEHKGALQKIIAVDKVTKKRSLIQLEALRFLPSEIQGRHFLAPY